MEIFDVSSLIVWSVIIGVGIVCALIVRFAWTMRILIATYVGLCLVVLMPESFAFNWYALIMYFGVITLIFALVEQGRFFNVSEWLVGRFSVRSIGLSVCLWLFISAIVCFLIPLSQIDFFMTESIYTFLREYMFYVATTPLIFSLFFSHHLR